MKNIIIGCPYTNLENIENAISDISENKVNVINTNEITRFSNRGFFLDDIFLPIDKIHSSFIRYPYDLIPPHSSTYILREKIEFYKSIALILDKVGINSLKNTWTLRNRAYSLSQAETYGAKVPEFWLSQSTDKYFTEDKWMLKATGNCFCF